MKIYNKVMIKRILRILKFKAKKYHKICKKYLIKITYKIPKTPIIKIKNHQFHKKKNTKYKILMTQKK